MMIRDFIWRHFQSEGFKRRLINWYLPALKQGLMWGYNKVHGYFESRYYEKIYTEGNKVIEQDVPSASSMPPAPTANASAVLSYDQAVVILKQYLINHDNQYLGTCVANTLKNAVRFVAKLVYGRDFDLSEGDVYVDRETLAVGLDQGMYPDRAIPRVAQKGIAIKGLVPTAIDLTELAQITREKYPDADLDPFRVKALTGGRIEAGAGDFERLWSYITNTYATNGLRPFQATILSYAGWWGTDVPVATGNVYGSHSVLGICLPFMYGNERAFFVIDSAYNTGRTWLVAKGVRIVKESTWRLLGNSVRSLSFHKTIEDKLKAETAPSIQLSLPAKRGDSGEHVEAIQRALMHFGYDIPAISSGVAPYGYYGQQTSDAVKKWQLEDWRLFNAINAYWTQATLGALNGDHFGSLSVRVMSGKLASE